MKADKVQELCNLMHKSIIKVDAIRDKQKSEMKEYSDNEIETIDVMKKRQHYE